MLASPLSARIQPSPTSSPHYEVLAGVKVLLGLAVTRTARLATRRRPGLNIILRPEYL